MSKKSGNFVTEIRGKATSITATKNMTTERAITAMEIIQGNHNPDCCEFFQDYEDRNYLYAIVVTTGGSEIRELMQAGFGSSITASLRQPGLIRLSIFDFQDF